MDDLEPGVKPKVFKYNVLVSIFYMYIQCNATVIIMYMNENLNMSFSIFRGVRVFYVAVVKKMIKTVPIQGSCAVSFKVS